MRTVFLTALAIVATHAWASFSPLPLELSRPGLDFLGVNRYVLEDGDTVTSVAHKTGLTVETLLSFNRIRSPRLLRPGQVLQVPARNGILLNLEEPLPLSDLASTYGVYPDLIRLANRLPASLGTVQGSVFVPGGRMDPLELRKTLGEYFLWPTKGGRITSYFGRRNDPFTGLKTTHSGVDIANYHGAPVLAAGDGVVTATGYNSILGNNITVNHGQGFVAVYGHLSAILTKPGKRVVGGQLIGRVGSTGYSTGPHLHFTAYRWNRLLDPMTLFG